MVDIAPLTTRRPHLVGCFKTKGWYMLYCDIVHEELWYQYHRGTIRVIPSIRAENGWCYQQPTSSWYNGSNDPTNTAWCWFVVGCCTLWAGSYFFSGYKLSMPSTLTHSLSGSQNIERTWGSTMKECFLLGMTSAWHDIMHGCVIIKNAVRLHKATGDLKDCGSLWHRWTAPGDQLTSWWRINRCFRWLPTTRAAVTVHCHGSNHTEETAEVSLIPWRLTPAMERFLLNEGAWPSNTDEGLDS